MRSGGENYNANITDSGQRGHLWSSSAYSIENYNAAFLVAFGASTVDAISIYSARYHGRPLRCLVR